MCFFTNGKPVWTSMQILHFYIDFQFFMIFFARLHIILYLFICLFFKNLAALFMVYLS